MDPPIATAHKVPVATGPRIRTCIGCGHPFTNDLGFCPKCGRMVSDKEDPNELFGHNNEIGDRLESETPNARQSFRYQQPDQQYRGNNPYQHQQNQSAPTYPNPYYQNQYPRQENTIPQPPNPGYGSCQYQQPEYRGGKDPKMAMVLAGFGFLGFMGIGHFYMGKLIKGIILLFAGGFLALMSAASVFLIFQPSEFPVEIRIITAAIFTVPFLLILIWQFFDAPKPLRSRKVEDPYGWNSR